MMDPGSAIALGTSLALVDGDFVLAGGDLAQVSGRENFVQALHVMIGTPFGSDPVNVGYGFDVAAIFSMAHTVRDIKDVIRLNIVKSLFGDDRVQAIGDVVFDDSADFARLAPELSARSDAVSARRSRVWHAVASFTTVQGTPERAALSGAMP